MNIELCLPAQGETLSLLSSDHRAMLSGGHLIEADNSLNWANLKRKGTENSYPVPVHFSFTADKSVGEGAFSGKLYISTDINFAESRIIILEPGVFETDVYNLISGKKYYWRVILNCQGEEVSSPVGLFYTADDAPTLYRVDGLTNVRDIGGWRTFDNRRVRRGLIFRGSEMDTHHKLTEEGRLTLRNELGIRTDLDLREEAVDKLSSSPIGEDIRFELIPVKAYAEFMEEARFPECRAAFTILADESAYPIYLHCWGGADRAGTVVLLLNALLGVDDEDLMLDYEMTMFSVWGERSRYSDLFQGLLRELDRYGSKDQPIRVKAENYLRAAGVPNEQIRSLRRQLIV